MSAGWSLHPRLEADTVPVASLGLSEVRLMDNAHYPWLVLVPRIADAVEWVDLDERDRHRLLDEATRHREGVDHIGFIGDVRNYSGCGDVFVAQFIHCFLKHAFIKIQEREAGALFSESLGNCFSESVGPA